MAYTANLYPYTSHFEHGTKKNTVDKNEIVPTSSRRMEKKCSLYFGLNKKLKRDFQTSARRILLKYSAI